jgi:hypothetical protein
LSINLDFPALPFRDDDLNLENQWVPMRIRAHPSVTAFVVASARRSVADDATANIFRNEADRMVLEFTDCRKELNSLARFWEE